MFNTEKLMSFTSLLLLLTSLNASTRNSHQLEILQKAEVVIIALDKVLDFISKYYYDMNIDGAFGVVLTEVQLMNILNCPVIKDFEEIGNSIQTFLIKCRTISKKIIQMLPKDSEKNILFIRFLLNPDMWKITSKFVDGELDNLGIYNSWTVQDILRNKTAEYRGVPSDECLRELLQETPQDLQWHTCYIRPMCRIFMFENRTDTGYVLTHRLLYLQVLRMVHCKTSQSALMETSRQYCSLMLKEAKTNEFLGFPQHDIFLEQVVLCGMEGFSEYLQEGWTEIIKQWQTVEGCYKPDENDINHSKIGGRSSNFIAFGCTNHATGLGAAALALNLRHAITNI